MIIKEAPETLEDEDLIEMVNAGLIPLIIVDKHKADFWKRIFPKITVHDGVAVRTGGDIAWAIRKGSPQLKAAPRRFRDAPRPRDHAQGNSILARYLKNTKYVKDAASKSERKKFLALIAVFPEVRGQVPRGLVADGGPGLPGIPAQSGRPQPGGCHRRDAGHARHRQRISRVGDITQTEPNIHAGVKYMRWMIDQLLRQEPMTQLDKALFAFASYNAGAGRVSQLRKVAAKRGLDPNVWFDNVEYRRRREDRCGDGDLRQQHLQVLHRLPPDHGSQGG